MAPRNQSRAPHASVLLPVFNEAPHLIGQAIASVLTQSFPDFELIVIDDGSDRADTRAALDRAAAADDRVRIVRVSHRGVYRALNAGLAASRGTCLFRQDADDWSAPERFQRQVAFLRAHGDLGLVGCDTQTHQEDGTPLWTWRYPLTPDEIAAALPARMPFTSGSVCVRRAALVAIGGFREDFPYGQDYDACWRIADRFGGANLPEVLYHYRFTRKAISTRHSVEQSRCAAIVRAAGMRRRAGLGEDLRAVVAAADADAPDRNRLALTRRADYLMLAGAHDEALRLYGRALVSQPISMAVWVRLLRWMAFVGVPGARPLLFRTTFRKGRSSGGAALSAVLGGHPSSREASGLTTVRN